jgi:NADP-dependent 3-hydroxy acid dehydrogenase YdfG/acyl carrier protein
LVSGGFGSVGRTFAQWLVQKGARHIWLIGRRGATDANSRKFVGDLRRQGVAVEAASLDVADAERLASQLSALPRNGPPLRGVIHAAGSNDESPAAALEWPALASLLPGKVQGGLALAQLTADAELDFFLSISSIAALWGSRRQAGYAWANAFLHGLSAWQRARNVAALTIDFGPLDRSTMLHDAAAQELRQLGLLPMPLSRAGPAADALLCLGVAQAAVVSADWPRFSELYRSRCPTGLFDAILQDNAAKSAGLHSHGNAHADHGISSRNLRAYFTDALGATLHLPQEGIDPDIPLPRLGLDSLGALDLRDRLKRALGVELPLPDLLGEYSLNGLLDHISAPPVKAGEPPWVTGEL